LPAPPAILADLAPLAQEHGLEHRKTGEMSVLQLRDDAVIGKLIESLHRDEDERHARPRAAAGRNS
jgi:hypothetical protein